MELISSSGMLALFPKKVILSKSFSQSEEMSFSVILKCSWKHFQTSNCTALSCLNLGSDRTIGQILKLPIFR